MLTCKLRRCGLGNQLFQIAATLALAWDNDDDAIFDFSNQSEPSQGNRAINYVDTIYRRLNKSDNVKIGKIHKEPHHHYARIPYERNLCLDGFFMSEKYFQNHRKRIIDTFVHQPISTIKDTCAIHVRQGDYRKMERYHPTLSGRYYADAMKLFNANIRFIVFSDDIDFCKEALTGNRYEFSEGNSDLEDLYLMASCEHQIIANSTFSWWGSYLNPNPDKIVIAPQTWFGKDYQSIITRDIYRKEMIVI